MLKLNIDANFSTSTSHSNSNFDYGVESSNPSPPLCEADDSAAAMSIFNHHNNNKLLHATLTLPPPIRFFTHFSDIKEVDDKIE